MTSKPVEYHDRLAKEWDAKYRAGGFKRRADFIRSRFLDRLQVGGRWLDAGCGTGFFARQLAARGAEVLGLDASSEMIDQAGTLAERAGLAEKLTFRHVQTIESVPAGDGELSGVLCLSVLEYLPDPDRALAELSRVLAPGGAILVSVPNRTSLVRAAQGLVRRIRADRAAYLDHSTRFMVSAEELRGRFGRAGLDTEDIAGFDPWVPRPLHAVAPPSLWFALGRKPR